MGLVRAQVNASFAGNRVGEIIEIDPDLWEDQLASGLVSLVGDDGERIIDAPAEQEEDTDAAERAGHHEGTDSEERTVGSESTATDE